MKSSHLHESSSLTVYSIVERDASMLAQVITATKDGIGGYGKGAQFMLVKTDFSEPTIEILSKKAGKDLATQADVTYSKDGFLRYRNTDVRVVEIHISVEKANRNQLVLHVYSSPGGMTGTIYRWEFKKTGENWIFVSKELDGMS